MVHISKTAIILALIGVGMGAVAGLLVVTFDFAPYMTVLLLILVVVALIDVVLVGFAYKKGKLRKA